MAKKPIELIEEAPRPPTRADRPPTDGYALEVDGKFKSHFSSTEAAREAGAALKKAFPFLQVKIYDAKERTRILIDGENAST